MMKIYVFLPFLAVLALIGCASPTFTMTSEQVRALSDEQICTYKNNYRDETKLEAEIARRNLNCNRYYRECLARGNQPGTQSMDFCMDVLRENERLRYEANFGHYDRYGPRHSGIYSGVGVGF